LGRRDGSFCRRGEERRGELGLGLGFDKGLIFCRGWSSASCEERDCGLNRFEITGIWNMMREMDVI